MNVFHMVDCALAKLVVAFPESIAIYDFWLPSSTVFVDSVTHYFLFIRLSTTIIII